MPGKVLLHSPSELALIDSIDMNLNNFLITGTAPDTSVRLVDFEPISVRYRARNNLHQAGMLWSLRYKRILAVRLYICGWVGMFVNLLRYQVKPFSDRVVDRQPSLFSVVVAECRTRAGRAASTVLQPFGLG